METENNKKMQQTEIKPEKKLAYNSIPFERLPISEQNNPDIAYFDALIAKRDSFMSLSETRLEFVQTFSFAIPCQEAIELLTAFSPILEVGSGSGFWTKLIRLAGGTCLAVDTAIRYERELYPFKRNHITDTVFWSDFKNMAQYSDYTLFLCWPPHKTSMAYDALRAYNGNTVLYIGEGTDGATGDDRFHDFLDNSGEWVEDVENYIELPQWYGIHDGLSIYHRASSLS
jgi:hypothetical protein